MPTEQDTKSEDAIWRYVPDPAYWDELQASDGAIRPHWQHFTQALREMGRKEFERRWLTAQQMVRNHSITYNVYGDAQGTERLWPLDPIPLIIPDAEWTQLEQAIAQRATLLNQILNDCYGPQRLLHEQKLPPELVFANPNFLRPCHGIPVPGDIRLHFYAVDLARSADGLWWVIADRTQVPSGAGYALENRLAAGRTLSNLFSQHSVRPLTNFFAAQRHGLFSLAGGNRRMVLLTPGPYNETYFEHSYLAKTFSIPLVEGPDLTVRDQRVYLKTLEGLEQVDLIFRRQDDDYCDPLELRGDSLLGVPGLLGAVRAGNVVIANALGSGLIETPAHRAFLPGLCRKLLGEELRLPSVATWWCGQPYERRFVLEHLHELIIKPTFPGFGRNPIFGDRLSAAERAELARKIELRPENYIAQELVSLSTAPVWTEDGLSSRHIMMRAYATWDGERYAVMPGGMTRVSNSTTSLIVSMQHGGGSKDTWVLGRPEPSQFARIAFDPEESVQPHISGDLPSRVADNLFWLGRYTERVEALIRLLRSVLPALAGEEEISHDISLDATVRLLVGYQYLPKSVLTAPIGEQLHQLEAMLTGMIYDLAGMSSLGWNLKQIRRSAWPLKERLSSDTWRVLQQLESEASRPSNPFVQKRPASLQIHLDQAITSLSAFAGLLSDSTTRGHGWRFLEIGRRLERALQMIELLRHGMTLGSSSRSSLDLVLQTADSSITYRSRYLTALRPNYVLDLLLIDETNPHAIGFQLASLVELTQRLPRQEAGDRLSAERRLALKAQTAVRLANTQDFLQMPVLAQFLDTLRRDLFDLSEALTGRYLTHIMPSRLTPV
ncbi:circularly permuted type 2 ATP-grasp protein [Bryobacter aggregatus]|uniref:circularly permuted type 2 ATP-grasp protein n=1 Tax=Bryobacter aggregatus TaxID=360054 RepID=UPI000A6D8F5F|nr:circularly permuted type 2 ATP-grasp protein [Bryobacter aggregatus]